MEDGRHEQRGRARAMHAERVEMRQFAQFDRCVLEFVRLSSASTTRQLMIADRKLLMRLPCQKVCLGP